MAKHLFIFGYQTPNQARNSELQGLNDEDSLSFFVDAETEKSAEEWGKVVAQMFLNALYEDEYEPPRIDSYFNGIEKNPESRFDESELAQLPALSEGVINQLEDMVEQWLARA